MAASAGGAGGAAGVGGAAGEAALSTFGAEDASGPLDPISHLCLSCHADDIAPAMAFRRAVTPSVFEAGSPVEGRPDAGAHAGLVWPDDRPDLVPSEVAVASGLPLYGPLEDRIGCATCHAPHGTGEGVPLRIANDRSRLCLTCHLK